MMVLAVWEHPHLLAYGGSSYVIAFPADRYLYELIIIILQSVVIKNVLTNVMGLILVVLTPCEFLFDSF